MRLAPQLGQKPLRSPKAPTVGAAEGDQTILVARGTLHPDKPMFQPPAFQEVVEFLFYVKWQRPALLLHQAGKGRVVMLYDLIEKCLLRLVTFILRKTGCAILAQCQ